MKDYHVHYHIDSCANDEMTLQNINALCNEIGIDEATVVKHYSHAMPNGEEHWICWHKIVPSQWAHYLADITAYQPKGMIIRSGVETELCNQSGDINIPIAEQDKIDMVALSVHYMPTLDCLEMDLMLYPNLSFCPEYNNDEGRRIVERWRQKANNVGAASIVAGLAEGYMNAIKRFPKVKTLAHMSDGLMPLRTYLIDLDTIGESRCIEIFEPLMRLMAERGVLWELHGPTVPYFGMLRRAHELGVSFCATADSHFLRGGWAPLTYHKNSVDFILQNGFNIGTIEF